MSQGREQGCERVVLRARRQPEPAGTARRRIAGLAAAIREAEPRLDDLRGFGASVRPGLGPGMAVIFGDSAEIRLIAAASRSRYDYRLAWLACPGDLAVIGGPRSQAFEDYQRALLAAPDLRYLGVETGAGPLRRPTPVVCLKDEAHFARLRDACAGRDEITLLPHIATGTIWGLAARLAAETGARLSVAGPPPLLTRRVNDKLWFGAVVERLLGPAARPEKRAASSFSALTRHVRDLARSCDRLVVKVPDSAGSEGNLPVQAAPLRRLRARAVFDHLRRRLARFAGAPPWPLAIEVWEANVIASPSAQLWLPLPEDGPPVLEGIYEQLLAGETQAFVGAAQAELPPAVEARLADEAMQLGLLFQALGYYGRLSLDAILSGTDLASARVQWVECNGRWGGVSIPMSLANRLPEARRLPAHAIFQNVLPGLPPHPFAEALRRAGTAEAPGRAVLLTPGPFETGAGAHLLALAETREAALALCASVVARLVA